MNPISSAQAETYRQARMAKDKRFDGRFFVAVKTTGIFCRPICPAPSPKESNVEYFTLAQNALQSGYRPCLRCRPDSAPDSFAWKGVDTTIERAIKLIRQAPEVDMQDLVERLGISDRYLRDLFNRKLGLGPKKFQMYEKLLFAKQLLHQSELTIEQVAQASGFSSSRRLQETMKRYLNLTPTQIRKQGPQELKTRQLGLNLSFRPPYQWKLLRDFFAIRAIPGMEEVGSDYYARTFRLGDAKGWFNARFDHERSQFVVQLDIDQLADIRPVVLNIRRVLDLDAAPDIVAEKLIRTGIPEHVIHAGLRIPGVWCDFEAGCRAVLGQQVSVKGAITAVTRLVSHLGERQGDRLYFPTPKSVAEDDLSWLPLPDARRQALRSLARFYADNPGADPQDWLALKGIGPWTIAYARMRGLSDPDVFLDGDLVIRKALQNFKVEGSDASPWRSYLTFQLWSMS